jgi:hypothetical protein
MLIPWKPKFFDGFVTAFWVDLMTVGFLRWVWGAFRNDEVENSLLYSKNVSSTGYLENRNIKFIFESLFSRGGNLLEKSVK